MFQIHANENNGQSMKSRAGADHAPSYEDVSVVNSEPIQRDPTGMDARFIVVLFALILLSHTASGRRNSRVEEDDRKGREYYEHSNSIR